MEEYKFNTRLKGKIALTYTFDQNIELQKDPSLYKFIWVQNGSLTLEIDHINITLKKDDIISLTPLHHLSVKEVKGQYLTLLFNSNFYCIYGHDNEVSCNGFLFNGTSNFMKLKLSDTQSVTLHEIIHKITSEYSIKDSLQEEMLRILLKRFIITCTRIAREKLSITNEKEKSFDIIRQFYVLVDNHFKEKKKVQEYADMLHRSPKTLTNLFSLYNLPSPLRIIHERIEAEAKRLLLYTSISAKEIAYILGFEDISSFSRFFKNISGESISDYRKKIKETVPNS
ncbi:helix-turn-helix domain-containing protein [Parabacteroides pacaensis]|uniref:helix-turn-helix domain-containing protein n=1 Tax=Parabacteroides pacaensis TaxID=2086575 RepID=UPI000D0E3988|nr:helix-turn-helix domain-containing protein [Parabacteroides pacaensis]